MKFLQLCLLCVVVFAISCTKTEKKGGDPPGRDQSASQVETVDGYNLLLITIDTLRADRIGFYSDEYVKTPNIDKLAQMSLVYDRAFAHNPVTLPSHINILTGTTPLFHGISDNSGFRLHEDFLTIAEHFQENGYATGAFVGAFPLDSRFGLNQGFDTYDDNYGTHSSLELFFVERKAEKVIKPALDWIKQKSTKWFSWIHLFDPHQPYSPPAPFDKLYGQDPYSGEVAYVDEQIGHLVNYLSSADLLQKTVIVITGDHGEALGEKGEKTHSYFAYNNTIHVPLIIYVPGRDHARISSNVSHIDIFPTLCHLFNLNIPDHLQGRSLMKTEKPDNQPDEVEIYFESMTPYLNRGWAPLRGFIKGSTKFIDLPIPELYDLAKDFNETNNLADAGRVKSMKRDLFRLMSRLKGEKAVSRSANLDTEVQKKMRSLGYLSGSSVKKKNYTRKDDLKTLLPLQNKMLMAIATAQQGQTDRAISELKEVISESPTFTLVYNHLANIYRDSGNMAKAIELLKQGLEKNPKNPNILSKLGIILVEANQPAEAIKVLEECVQMETYNPENFNYLGVAYYKSGKFNQAMENYNKALFLDNNNATVYNNIGTIFLVTFLNNKEESAYSSAMDNFNRALKIDPKLYSAYNSRGAAYNFKKDYQSAISDWEKAIEYNPEFIDAYFNISIAFLRTGNRTAAIRYLQLCKTKFYNRLPARDRGRLERLIKEAIYYP